MEARENAVTNPTAAGASIKGSICADRIDDMQAFRTGLELARASQLTMVRLQLALHKSNRRTAMQALDNLLDIDAEMEGLAATLNDTPTLQADDAALFGFIGCQKEAIAAEKHALTGGDLRFAPEPIVASLPDDDASRVDDADPPAPLLLSDEDTVEDDRSGSRHWIYGLVAAIVIMALGYGLAAYIWPALPMPTVPF